MPQENIANLVQKMLLTQIHNHFVYELIYRTKKMLFQADFKVKSQNVFCNKTKNAHLKYTQNTC